jgi:uncharacterized protein (TIGR02217 family)
MPTPVFPTLTMPTGSYTWPITKYAEYATIVLPSATNRGELAKSMTLYPIWRFELDVALLMGDLSKQSGAASAVAALVGFHMQVRGRCSTWLFNDPYDNATDGQQPFGTGDAVTTAFQLIRAVANGTDIIQNLTGAPSIYVNSVLQSPTSYSISSLGVITFAAAPAVGASLKWSGNFNFRCRFDEDKLSELMQIAPSTWQISKVAFHSVIL